MFDNSIPAPKLNELNSLTIYVHSKFVASLVLANFYIREYVTFDKGNEYVIANKADIRDELRIILKKYMIPNLACEIKSFKLIGGK